MMLQKVQEHWQQQAADHCPFSQSPAYMSAAVTTNQSGVSRRTTALACCTYQHTSCSSLSATFVARDNRGC